MFTAKVTCYIEDKNYLGKIQVRYIIKSEIPSKNVTYKIPIQITTFQNKNARL